MFLTALIIGGLLATAALILYIDHLNAETLRGGIKDALPETLYAEVERILENTEKEYSGITFKIKACRKDGTKTDVEVRCKSSELKLKEKIYV